MRSRLRVSFAARLLAGSLVIVVTVLVGISAFLLVSRDRQARGAALSNADNRAGVLNSLLRDVTATTGVATARQLAAQPALAEALAGAAPWTSVPALFPETLNVTAPGHYLAVIDAQAEVLVDRLAGAGLPSPTETLASVRLALSGAAPIDGIGGVEVLGDAGEQRAVVSSAAPVIAPGGQAPLGVVLDIAPLSEQLSLFGTVVGSGTDFRTAFVAASDPTHVSRLDGRTGSEGPLPAAVTDQLRARGAAVDATYDAPVSGDVEEVAGSFLLVRSPDGRAAGYVGVEAPLSVFAGDTRGDELSLALISLFVILATAIAVFVFVDRFVRRPVAQLERGVARIAGGDYATDMPVRSRDELGRLAGSVNRMRAQIQSNVAEIERGRARLDRAVEHLGGVSRALTTTTSGVEALQRAVVTAAASITGGETAAILLTRVDDELVPGEMEGITGEGRLDRWGVVEQLCAGKAVRVESAPAGWRAGGLLAVPMFYQGEVIGALAIVTPYGQLPEYGDEQALAALANNAAVALENTRLFEQERETVRKLIELDAAKSDFLATVQHELRTPLTAIIGMSDLLEMCWPAWGEAEKLEAIADIQAASKGLYDIVETIIDFSLLERDTLGLNPAPTAVGPVVTEAVEAVTQRLKGGLPVEVSVEVSEAASVYADPARFAQVIRALLDNAVKFTPAGGHVSVRASSNGALDGMTRLVIADDGIGIPSGLHSRIFERFYQVDNSATRAYGGTGMGLALVLRLLDAHGAYIEVDSELGEGSRFTVMWPAHAADAAGEAGVVARTRGEA